MSFPTSIVPSNCLLILGTFGPLPNTTSALARGADGTPEPTSSDASDTFDPFAENTRRHRNPANPIGGGALIAAGAVGAILEAPGDAQHAYKIPLNDGRGAMLQRSEFPRLKEFKGEGIDATAQGMDLEDWKAFVIYRCVVGSQAFGVSAMLRM